MADPEQWHPHNQIHAIVHLALMPLLSGWLLESISGLNLRPMSQLWQTKRAQSGCLGYGGSPAWGSIAQHNEGMKQLWICNQWEHPRR